ncbi:MAG: hypothetical protein KGJ86_11200, partial [Chloroflexota bacterium]|nr:hypothetical protein [Chloroflexota bacterium]
YTEDLYFERVADDVRSAMLQLPYVIVRQQTDPVFLTVPLSGRHLKDSFDVNQTVTMGGYTFRVTDAYVSEPGLNEPRGSGLVLDLGLDLGDWQNGGRLQSPGLVEVNDQRPADIQF